MDTKLKKYSHSIVTKIAAFIIAVICLTGVIQALFDVEVIHDSEFGAVFDESYFLSNEYVRESENLIYELTRLIGTYKNEEHILNGGTIRERDLNTIGTFKGEVSSETHVNTKKGNAEQIEEARARLIKEDLREFHNLVQRIEEYKNPLYYISDGTNVYTNSSLDVIEQVENFSSYMAFTGYKSDIFPQEVKRNEYYYRIEERVNELDPESTVLYVAFTDEFVSQNIAKWEKEKEIVLQSWYRLLAFLIGFILSFVYLVVVIGRNSFKDEKFHWNTIDKLYNDINVVLIHALVFLWVASIDEVAFHNIAQLLIPITIPFAAIEIGLLLSIIKHIKNRTFFKHTLLYTLINKLVTFVRNVYETGNVGVKTVLLVIGYPLLIAATFFMFPITIGVAAWFTYKKVKSFKTIKEGVERIKNGEIHHTIDVGKKGEFATLASNINGITDGLKNAVENELKSERLKTELITNVSHDIRTPLTSIITYIDLLKKETDTEKIQEYVKILDQKSQRLKLLTDDLFDAAKASSGNIPVELEQIDIISLVTQGLGELNNKIETSQLDFKVRYPKEKIYVAADGKLLWRSVENVLSNIFKYALAGSRVYIDMEEAGEEVILTFKNISAYELNITADELMERFKRGDESRHSQGSGLGLSISKSLIELQKGSFKIEIDGDLFKAIIKLPRYKG
ncbi:HAMP domain-containing sensor histidine kinase [Bacillus carboniphilus]|uniref:histidine kinase n=1 Tax=Bacillus carboniphilus TaxID=86663 RepID=A0ABN0WH00_9BACI